MRKIYFSSFENFKFEDQLNLSFEELKVLKDLSSRKYLTIQKADNGNSVFILNKMDDMKIMTAEMLSDIDQFKKGDA